MAMGLTILNVACVFAPVGPDTAGGAEQVLAALDRALVAEGYRSLVIACAGSKTAGELLDTAPLPAKFTEDLRRQAQQEQFRRVSPLARRPDPGDAAPAGRLLPAGGAVGTPPGVILQLRLGLAAADFPGQ